LTDSTLVEVHVLRSDEVESAKSLISLRVTPSSQLVNAMNVTRLENELYLVESSLEYLSTRSPKINYLEFIKLDCLDMEKQQQPVSFAIVRTEFYEYLRFKKQQQLHQLTYSIDDDLNTLFSVVPRSSTGGSLNINNMNTHTLLNRIKNRSKFLVALMNIRITTSVEDQSTNMTIIFVMYDRVSGSDDRAKLVDLKFYLVEKLLPRLNAASGNSSAYFINNYYKRIGLVNTVSDTNERSLGSNYFR
jgi:hypothetical protein